MAPGALERILHGMYVGRVASMTESRVLAGRARHEDAAVVTIPPGFALVQTVDILAPIVNDPFHFGRIAAANALSDVYALGGKPWCAMNLVCFPVACKGEEGEAALRQILRGGLDTLEEAGAALVGGHTVEDVDIKYGLSVTGLITPGRVATNDGLLPGDRLILTKPLGTGVLATGVKARWDHWEASERLLQTWCGRLNSAGAAVIEAMGLRAATDITGFGLGGHALEMALASQVTLVLDSASLPLLDNALAYALDGLIPSGSHANRRHWAPHTRVLPTVSQAMETLVFDVQTSGGLLLAVPEARVDEALARLSDLNSLAWGVGYVLPSDNEGVALILR